MVLCLNCATGFSLLISGVVLCESICDGVGGVGSIVEALI